MSIFIDKNTKVIVQGITGKEGSFHTQSCLDYGTQILAGVTPFKGGQTHLGVKIYNTVKEAKEATGADVSMVFVPANFCKDAIIEAANAGIRLCVVITEHLPVLDMLEAKTYAKKCGMKIIGPNSPGIISAGECKLGIMPSCVFEKDKINVGIISKSGTLTYEAANQIKAQGFGISSAIGIGGDAVIGMAYDEILLEFDKDEDTKAIVMIGEIGGELESNAADIIRNLKKPVVAFIAGASAPQGRKMGHAGAIINSKNASARAKFEILESVGAYTVTNPAKIGEKLKQIYNEGKFYDHKR
ncbi:succinate--CoA ligase subunit alpha [Campylobacter sp. RM9344]|uniref:Succinate--CoA ligase [ADP-forming] subunit alpha n=1 Tax=Campylobacter californiensis TaxID=1032243 RepID=A0AAW3ZTY0_9BACT|nr:MULTISPECIES: succinate--CoA ligase subunit alpha [unclassified Campylobacter]MBE2984272.1 succinate--CoA ligase subunit alpha [Campylobacter sp. RM6883]MBE2985973.1 succinate--CoA ligase subunit alpha [Campylobacter sp. RM12919]MBE2988347.1 succinate--CoA ligase subunit alpha [Campylobacter sp. RM12920]MBE2994861.1 succinate--CoA ligase subunit alpha [Campylobacter sp. RM6913]MBE3029501.1 succinate--CoA ligase subunit alpha [Campylobacter sp. RM9344]